MNNGKKTVIGGMEYAFCRNCNKFIKLIDEYLCSECRDKDVLKQLQIMSYLNANPNSSITETANANGITTDELLRYIEDGHIIMTQGLKSEKLLSCTRCEQPINTGIMCDICRIEFNEGVRALKKESDKNKLFEKGLGMHNRQSRDGRKR